MDQIIYLDKTHIEITVLLREVKPVIILDFGKKISPIWITEISF